VLASVTPAYGSTNGGEIMTIRGSGFTSNVFVFVGGVAARSVSVLSSTQIMVVTPGHPAGTVGVTVALANGPSLTLNGAYSYRVPDGSGTVPPPGSPVTTTTTRPTAPTTAPASPTTATTAPTTAPPPPTAPPTTAPGRDLNTTRFTFGESAEDAYGQHLRRVTGAPLGLAPPAQWGAADKACLTTTCPTFRL